MTKPIPDPWEPEPFASVLVAVAGREVSVTFASDAERHLRKVNKGRAVPLKLHACFRVPDVRLARRIVARVPSTVDADAAALAIEKTAADLHIPAVPDSVYRNEIERRKQKMRGGFEKFFKDLGI